MKDVICSEAELSIAANNIVEYADFLVRSIESYVSILSEIQGDGIKDDLVCARLSEIANKLSPCKITISKVCEDVQSGITSYMSDVSAADKFVFPSDITSTIATLVSQFL